MSSTQPPEPPPVTITIRPSTTPARDLPHGMLSDIATVLGAYGLRIREVGQVDPTIWATLLVNIGEVVDAVPVPYGGRKRPDDDQPRRWVDTGSGSGWSPDDGPGAGS